MTREKRSHSSRESKKFGEGFSLLLVNDDFNTFEHVIESLVEVCGHYPEQAEQCATITHYKGSYIVKSGSYKTMNSMHDELISRALTVEIIKKEDICR
jgi:ATP-dependent Clp protease adaptor protein ClpS